MAKLITTYDNTLKEKVFVLKGEEAYAKSTDTVLTELPREEDWNRHLDYMLIGFEVDVHRNVGESSIVLYDNDDVIDVIPFDLGSTSVRWEKYYDEDTGEWVDNRMKLAYGVEHNIYAKYMGNKQCLKSQSKVYQFSEETPNFYLSALEFVDVDSYYDANSSIDISVQLVADDYYDEQTVKLYDNSSLIGTAITDDDGVAVFENVDILQGLHNFVVRFGGAEFLLSSETSMLLSGGYTISIIEKPSYIVDNNPSSVTVLAKDYLDEPKSSVDVTIQSYNGTEWDVVSQTKYTNSLGEVTISPAYLTNRPFRAINTQFNYVSDEYTVPSYSTLSVYLESEGNPPYYTSKGSSFPIIGEVSPVSAPVEVTMTYSKSEEGDVIYTDTVTTDSSGKFTTSYIGTGEGTIWISAKVTNDTFNMPLVITDYIQYWKASSSILNREYELETSSTLTNYTNGFGLSRSGNGWASISFKNTGYDISFKVISTNAVLSVTGSNSQVQIKAGDTVRVLYDSRSSYYRAKIIVNNSAKLDEYVPITTTGLGFKIYNSSTSPMLIFDELKIIKGGY